MGMEKAGAEEGERDEVQTDGESVVSVAQGGI